MEFEKKPFIERKLNFKDEATGKEESISLPPISPEDDIFTQAETWLEYRYQVRYNEVANVLEGKEPEAKNWHRCNVDDIFVGMHKAGIKITKQKLESLLASSYVPVYNPFISYFESLPEWKPGLPDYIGKLASYVKAKKPAQWATHLKKHLVRTIACAIVPDFFNKHCLTIVGGEHNSGKTTFARFLTPPELKDYFCEDINLENKDGNIAITENLFINLDELSQLAKVEINKLKAIFSKVGIKERRPYGKVAEPMPRRASFLATSNNYNFLTDPTGSIRWLCFDIDTIDWAYSKEVDMKNVYSQAYYLFKTGFVATLTKEEQAENEIRNLDFREQTPEMELLTKYFKPTKEGEYNSEFRTASEIIVFIGTKEGTFVRLSPVNMGRALQACGFDKTKKGDAKTRRYGYIVEQIHTTQVGNEVPVEVFKQEELPF
jgi:predicted P-loop ATPase